jgi:hypothetical protein
MYQVQVIDYVVEGSKSMNDKKKAIIIVAIAMVSVFAMIVWGTIAGTYHHAWLACMAGGIAIAIVAMIGGSDKSDDDKDNS